MTRRPNRFATLAVAGLGLACAPGCGDRKPEVPASAPLAAPSAASLDPAREAALVEARKRPFTPQDFVESETNRDPFRRPAAEPEPAPAAPHVAAQYKIALARYSLDELRLAAVSGPATHSSDEPSHGSHTPWRATFKDPHGGSATVARGDHLAAEDARVKRISTERVYVEVAGEHGATVMRVFGLRSSEPGPKTSHHHSHHGSHGSKGR